jgi:adenylate cyclase
VNAAELARQAGTTPEQIERLAELGLLPARRGDEPFGVEDIHRVRFAQALEDAGISLEDIGRLVAAGLYSFDFIEGIFPGTGWPLIEKTFGEAAEEVGLSWETVQQLYTNWGLPAPAPDQPIREDDARILRDRAAVRRAGNLDEESLIAGNRFFGDNIRRMAASQVRWFRERVMGPLEAKGMPTMEALRAIGPMAVTMQESSADLRSWLYDRHLEAHIFQQSIEFIEEILKSAGYARTESGRVPAIAFFDMGGYTRLSEASRDEEAAELAARLAGLVALKAREHRGQTVKVLGDGVMFHFDRPVNAVACGLELVDVAETEGLPPARYGASAGPVVFRDGDYFGQTVNVASRITEYARPGEVLVSEAVVEQASGDALEFEPIGPIALRGLLEPVPLYLAAKLGADS